MKRFYEFPKLACGGGGLSLSGEALVWLLRVTVQSRQGAAAHWLGLFNAAYSRKLQMPVRPGSLNLALDHNFDWFAACYKASTIWFGREEYGGERDILMMPCELV